MNTIEVKRFRSLFLSQKKKILSVHRTLLDDLEEDTQTNYSDEADQASSDMERQLRLQLRDREQAYLKKIEFALKRIDSGAFGICQNCGEDIETKRLEVRPTATLCISCKEEEEKQKAFRHFKILS